MEDNEDVEEYNKMSIQSFFMKHSFRDVKRKQGHFFLSFCSVFVVVLSALIINTIIEKGPIIFLKLAESQNGQYDGILMPSSSTSKDIKSFENKYGEFINYTHVMEITKEKNYNLSPRKQFCGANAGSDYYKMSQRYDDQFLF
jgi:hypothetical protein